MKICCTSIYRIIVFDSVFQLEKERRKTLFRRLHFRCVPPRFVYNKKRKEALFPLHCIQLFKLSPCLQTMRTPYARREKKKKKSPEPMQMKTFLIWQSESMGGSLDHYAVVMRDERGRYLNFKYPSYYIAAEVQECRYINLFSESLLDNLWNVSARGGKKRRRRRFSSFSRFEIIFAPAPHAGRP